MNDLKSSILTIRVSSIEKEKFRLLSVLENKSISQVVLDLVDKDLKSRKLSATDIRKLSKETRTAILLEMTEEAMPVYNKYKQELFIDETGDGIE
jgi:hypothetical protein